MKSSLTTLVAFAIFSSVVSLDLGRLLGLRRDWRDLSSQPTIPQVVEVVRWRQPVCVVPGPGVPPCLVALKKHQVEYERNSAQGIDASGKDQKTRKTELEKAIRELGLGSEKEIEKFCKEEYKSSRSGDSRSITNDSVDVCRNWFDQWDEWSGRSDNVEAKKSTRATNELGASRTELIEQFCTHKFVNLGESDAKAALHLAKIMRALRELGILRHGDDSGALDHICDSFIFSPRILSPQVVGSVDVESVDRVQELHSSEGRSINDHTVTLNLRSSTPGMDQARLHRRGKYLMIAGRGSSNPSVRTPPAIYVTKVLNSPVTATLVANNCFPDIGVPLCDEYQQTLTIYKKPLCSGHHINLPQGSASGSEGHGFPAAPVQNVEQVAVAEASGSSEVVQENTDFWDDPTNPHFDDGTTTNETEKPTGILGQAVQHVLSKPGVISAIPPNVIEAIANNPALIEALANGGQPGAPSDDSQINIKPQVDATATTSKPGLMSSFLDIKKPIFDKFWNPVANIFNRSTTAKPEVTEVTGPPIGGHFSGGIVGHGHGHGQVIEAIQNFIHKPAVVSVSEKPVLQPVLVVDPPQKPSLFDNIWNHAGDFGLFDKHSTSTEKPATTEEPDNVFTSAISDDKVVEPKPTQAPGLFGGLFSNPSKPIAVAEGAVSDILEIGSSILSHVVNKPLIIERPGAKPLLVEKPIYIQEKPAGAAGLLNFFIPASSKPLLNVEHEVIKEPVYVYQKPQTASGILSHIFGADLSKPAFFQGWATFGKHPKKPTEQKGPNTKTEEIPQEGQHTKGASGESAASAIAHETRDPIATESTEKVEAIDKAASSTGDATSEAIATVQTLLKSAIPIDDIAEENISKAPVEFTGPETEETSNVNDDKIAVDIPTSASSVDTVNLPSIENEVRDAEVAVGAEAILEDSERNVAETSEPAAQEGEESAEDSAINNEA